jgi:hypothetical protein
MRKEIGAVIQPSLSADNVKIILDDIEKYQPSLVIEFGSGGSTQFFIQRLSACKYLAFENTRKWFFELTESIERIYGLGKLARNYWRADDYRKFLTARNEPYTPIPPEKSRYKNWTEVVRLHWFWLVSPDCSATRFPKISRVLWMIFRPLLIQAVKFLRLLRIGRLYDALWVGCCNSVEVSLFLFPPAIKDQFGENPFRDKYLKPALSSMTKLADEGGGRAFVFIDGGPRHYLLDKIYAHARSLSGIDVHFYLFDAQRPEYEEILNKYPVSKYCKGSRHLLDGRLFYVDQSDEHLEKEMWISVLSENV